MQSNLLPIRISLIKKTTFKDKFCFSLVLALFRVHCIWMHIRHVEKYEFHELSIFVIYFIRTKRMSFTFNTFAIYSIHPFPFFLVRLSMTLLLSICSWLLMSEISQSYYFDIYFTLVYIPIQFSFGLNINLLYLGFMWNVYGVDYNSDNIQGKGPHNSIHLKCSLFSFFFLKSSKIRFMLRLGLPWYKCGCHTHTGHNVIHTHKHRWLHIYPWPFSMLKRTWGYFVCLSGRLRQIRITYFKQWFTSIWFALQQQ